MEYLKELRSDLEQRKQELQQQIEAITAPLMNELGVVTQMLELMPASSNGNQASLPKQKPQQRKRGKAKRKQSRVSTVMRERTLEFVTGAGHPVRSRDLAKALDVTVTTAGKALMELAEDRVIQNYGLAPGEKGKVNLFATLDYKPPAEGEETGSGS